VPKADEGSRQRRTACRRGETTSMRNSADDDAHWLFADAQM
jgi:hypothetical protein